MAQLMDWGATGKRSQSEQTEVHGGRASLLVGVVAGLVVAALGTIVGATAGFYPGPVDQSLMRFTDLVLGLPLLPVAIVVGRVLPELTFLPGWMREGALGIAILLGFLLWGTLARIVLDHQGR